jgi:hypothetical protein
MACHKVNIQKTDKYIVQGVISKRMLSMGFFVRFRLEFQQFGRRLQTADDVIDGQPCLLRGPMEISLLAGLTDLRAFGRIVLRKTLIL